MYNVEKFIAGEEEELDKIVLELTPQLMRYCSSILLNFADAEDAVQTTFIRAYQKRHKIRNPEAFVTYIYRIAYSASIDIIRARRFFVVPDEELKTDRGYISDEMKDALLKLSYLDRAIVYGRVIEGYSYEDLAKIHGKSETSLRKRYERAKKKMALSLENSKKIEEVKENE